jgi:uncharacterized protein (DUF2062 family)
VETAAVTRVRRAVVARLGAVLRLDDPPWRVALALAVGVFISCTPFWGLQTVLSLAIATIFRLNRAVTVTGAWLNLPWFAPVVYGFALRIGALVLPDLHGADVAEIVELLRMSSALPAADMLDLLRSVSLALLIGTAAVGTVAGALTYVGAFVFLKRIRAARSRHV